MAMTTSNSISVKPLRDELRMSFPPGNENR
jgi:hypothetical protein